MTNNVCAKCGAELVAGTRFCRRCGHASVAFDGGSVTEAETRIFEATAERGAQTQYYDQRPTGPSYLSPHDPATPAAPATGSPQPGQRNRKHSGILWGSLIIIVAIIALTLFAAIKITRNVATTTFPPGPEIPDVPKVTQPPQAPQPPVAETGSSSALDYPGAEVTMEMTRGAEGSMRQLRTTDSFDKVVAWYTDKLKPTEKRIIREGPTGILKGKEMTAIITGEEDGTQILLKGGIDK
jgi:hypothetical protein